MGKLVAAFAVSHAPGQTGRPEAAPPEKKERIFGAWNELKRKLEASVPDLIVGISNDHFQNFFRVQPSFCVGTGEAHMLPNESFAKKLRLDSRSVKGHVDFAWSLVNTASENGMDLAYSEELIFEDEFAIPKHFLDPSDRIPLVPILTNCLNRNQPSPKRFYELGKIIAKTIQRRPAEEKVAVIGTGGLSHDPTGPNWCLIDEEFDRRFLELLVNRDVEALFQEYTLKRIFEPGKGGTPEILNWFSVLGAVGGELKATVHGYEPVSEWATGMGYVSWEIDPLNSSN